MLFFEDFNLHEIATEIIEIPVTSRVPYSPTYKTADIVRFVSLATATI
jgi:hypothetical protein